MRAVALRGLGLAVGLAVGALLSGCGPQDPFVNAASVARAGNWRIDRQIDRVTGAPVAGAMLFSSSSSHTAVIGSRVAGLQLTCFERQPIVRLSFEFKIGSDKNTVMGYRFDDKPGRDNVESRVLLGYQVIVIEDKAAVAQFAADLAGASQLYVRIRSLNGGRTTAEFPVSGGDVALKEAYADCPLSAAPAQRSS